MISFITNKVRVCIKGLRSEVYFQSVLLFALLKLMTHVVSG